MPSVTLKLTPSQFKKLFAKLKTETFKKSHSRSQSKTKRAKSTSRKGKSFILDDDCRKKRRTASNGTKTNKFSKRKQKDCREAKKAKGPQFYVLNPDTC